MKKRPWITMGFIIYCVAMLWLLFDRDLPVLGEQSYWEYVAGNIVLKPGRTIRLFGDVIFHPEPYIASMGLEWYISNRRHAIINLVGNVLLFIPLGFFLPWIWEGLRKWWKTIAATAVIMTFLEIIQALTLRGTCDVDDLLLNTLGAWIGYGCYLFVKKCCRSRRSG